MVIDGSIADPQQVAGIDLDVALQGDELGELIKFFGHPLRRSAPPGPRPPLRLARGAARQRDQAVGRAHRAQRTRAGQRRVKAGPGAPRNALDVSATISDSEAASRLFDATLPRLPLIHPRRSRSGVADGYMDELKLTIGRSALQGHAVYRRPAASATLGDAVR